MASFQFSVIKFSANRTFYRFLNIHQKINYKSNWGYPQHTNVSRFQTPRLTIIQKLNSF